MADHIIQKKGESTWYVRLDIPKDVRRYFGNQTVLIQSLKTGLRSEAMERRLAWLASWKAEIESAREAKVTSKDEWREAQQTAGLQLQQMRQEAVTQIFKPSEIAALPADVSWLKRLPEFVKDMLEEGHHELAARLTTHAKRYLDLFLKGITPGEAVDMHEEYLSILGDVQSIVTADEYGLSEVEEQEAIAIVRQPTIYKPRSPITKTMVDNWASHLETQIQSAKTRDSHCQRLLRLITYLTAEGAPLSFDTVHAFLCTLPPARQTRSNYLWTGRSFWKWANKYNKEFRDQFQSQPCPFDGHELSKTGDAAGVKRLPFTRQQIEVLHQKALDNNKPLLAHLIQFGAYTGARLEEIGRIQPEDVILNSAGEAVGFSIKESKTEAGIRDMPIHPNLMPLFKKLSASAAENGGYLFPGGRNKYANRLDGLSKQFGRMKAKDYTKDYTFHSIRHSVTTALHQAGFSVDVVPYILGHETESFSFAQYSAGPSLEQKAAAIQCLEYNFTPTA